MSAMLRKAVLTVSIDLELAGNRLAAAERRAIESAADRIAELLLRHGIAATWVVADPAESASIGRLVASPAGHEVALWGDASWAGKTAGRLHFGRELARHLAAAREQGAAVSTLAVSEVHLEQHFDLVVKHGLTAVRHERPTSSRAATARPDALRHGLWSFPVTCRLPGASRWLPGGGGGRAIVGLIDRAIGEHELVHVTVDARTLAERGPAAERVLDKVLSCAVQRQSVGALRVSTIAGAVAALTGQYQTRPSRSILRAA
jgi:hypothetical protein